MADAPRGAQAGIGVDHLAHQLVGVQRTLHQRFGLAFAHQRHRPRRRGVAVLDVDDDDAGEVDALLFGHRADLRFRADQRRHDEAGLRRLHHAEQGFAIAGVHHGHGNRRQALGAGEQVLVARLAVEEGDFRQLDARALDLLGRRQHLGRAADHRLAVLVGAHAVEEDVVVVVELARRRQRHGDGVAESDRAREMQRLVDVDGARAGELGAEHGGDQRAAPHAVGDHLLEHAALGVFGIDVGRVDVARHDGEELDVLRLEGADEGGAVADLDLVEGAVLDVLHGFHDGSRVRFISSIYAGKITKSLRRVNVYR